MFNRNFLILYLFIAIFLVLCIFSLFTQNWPNLLPNYISKLKFLNFSESVTALLSLFSLYFILEGFELNFRPLLSYNTKVINDIEMNKKVWQVLIKNRGNGSALMEKIEFEYVATNSQTTVKDFTQIVQKLSHLEKGMNFHLKNISPGASLSKDEELLVLEIPADKIDKIERFDIKFTFKSFLGQLYEKEVYLLPLNKTTHKILYK